MLGFVILSHRNPAQLARLCATLNQLYDFPPISVHHDVSQSPLDTSTFSGNVRFVVKPAVTSWGRWSLVEATLLALRQLYDFADPDYFALISAVDYPVAPPERVMSELHRGGADALLDHYSLEDALRGVLTVSDPHLQHHRLPHNVRLAAIRYLWLTAKVPVIRFRPPAFSTTLERYPRLGAHTLSIQLRAPLAPYSDRYRCYVGSQWFTGSRRSAHVLLKPNGQDLRLQQHLRRRLVPDESYVQTVLCNRPGLNIVGETRRFAHWPDHLDHPAELDESYLPQLTTLQPHFARKFKEDAPVLDRLDELLGVQPSSSRVAEQVREAV